jgi:hypothetical protein
MNEILEILDAEVTKETKTILKKRIQGATKFNQSSLELCAQLQCCTEKSTGTTVDSVDVTCCYKIFESVDRYSCPARDEFKSNLFIIYPIQLRKRTPFCATKVVCGGVGATNTAIDS